VSALEPYKRVDLAIAAFARLGRPLLIAGRGTLERDLRAVAPSNVKFLGWVSNEELRQLYRNCRALIFPGQEDFGIVPVEAQACGRPVVAYSKGGALETVLDGRTGVFFSEPTAESLAAAVIRLEQIELDPAGARRNSLRFSRDRFEAEMRQVIDGKAQETPKETRALA
jgi:glycosyltransferase involved in cell wall biosynthesis